MTRATSSPESPTEERWAALGGVLLASMYLWIIVWLLLAVLVPTAGLGWSPVVITSGSMEPLIRAGDVVVTGDVPEEPVGAGTVITFEDPARAGSLTTHRVIAVTADGEYRTRGDANASADRALVGHDAIVGVGRVLVPLIGLPLLWLSGGLLLFVLWVGVTLAAIAVAAQPAAEQAEGASVVTPGSRRAPQADRPETGAPATVAVARIAAAVRPRNVQRRTVDHAADRLAPWITRAVPAARPVAGRVRAWLPTGVIAAAAGAAARTPMTIAGAAVLLMAVLFLDPNGPELRIGRWHRTGVKTAHVVAAALPTMALGRGMLALVGVAIFATSTVGRSAAAYSAATTNTDNGFEAAASFGPPPAVCPGPGKATVYAAGDTYVDQNDPTASFAGVKELVVRSTSGKNTRTLLTFSMPVPEGCTVNSATLQVHTVTSKAGRTYQLVRADQAFDPATVTWANQPTATGSIATGTSGANGPTTFDATAAVDELRQLGNTGLVIRDAVENDGGTSTNKFRSLEGTSDQAEWPQLHVSWS